MGNIGEIINTNIRTGNNLNIEIMPTKMNIIVSKNKVYTTYIETICYEQEYSNEDLKQIAINGAKIALVNYAIYFGSVLVQVINISEQVTKDEDIFDILEKQHKQ